MGVAVAVGGCAGCGFDGGRSSTFRRFKRMCFFSCSGCTWGTGFNLGRRAGAGVEVIDDFFPKKCWLVALSMELMWLSPE